MNIKKIIWTQKIIDLEKLSEINNAILDDCNKKLEISYGLLKLEADTNNKKRIKEDIEKIESEITKYKVTFPKEIEEEIKKLKKERIQTLTIGIISIAFIIIIALFYSLKLQSKPKHIPEVTQTELETTENDIIEA